MIIKRTGTSKSISASCKYIGDYSTKAHANANGVIKRNQLMFGIGVDTSNVHTMIDSFKRLAKKNDRARVKLVNFAISPRPNTINKNNENDVYNFMEYARRVTQKAFPHHLAEIAIQWDNKHAIPHAHILVSNLSTLPNHHAINHKYINSKYIGKVGEMVRRHGFSKRTDPLTLDPVNAVYSPKHHQKQIRTVRNNDLATKAIVLENKVLHDRLTYQQAKHYAKSIGLQMKRTRRYRHDMHVKNPDGTFKRNKYGRKIVKYRRTKDGKHFIWRKNKHGHRVKVPEKSTSKSYVLFRLTPNKSTSAHNRRYRTAHWLGISDDVLQKSFKLNRKRYKPSRAKRGKSTTKQVKTAHTPKISHSKPTYTQATASRRPTKAINQPTKANSQATVDDDLRMLKIAPKIEPALHGLSQDDGTVLKDDIDLMPTFSKSAFSDKNVRKSQQTKALSQIQRNNQNVTKPNADRFKTIIINVARQAKLDYHKTAILARHYAKAIHEYFIKLKKKTAEKLTKAVDKANKRAVDSNRAKDRPFNNNFANSLINNLLKDKGNETKQRQALNRKRKHKHDKPAYNPGNAGGAKVRRRIAEHQKARRANYQAHNHGNHFERT